MSGWILGDYANSEILMHGGDTFTTHTLIFLSREHEYGVFVSSNGGGIGETEIRPESVIVLPCQCQGRTTLSLPG